MKTPILLFSLTLVLLLAGCGHDEAIKATALVDTVAIAGRIDTKVKEASVIAKRLPKSEDVTLLKLTLTDAEKEVTGLKFNLEEKKKEIKEVTDKANDIIGSKEQKIKSLELMQKYWPWISIILSALTLIVWIFSPLLKTIHPALLVMPEIVIKFAAYAILLLLFWCVVVLWNTFGAIIRFFL